MRQRLTLIICLLVAVGFSLGPATVSADDSSEIDAFTGTYRSTLSKSQARKQIDKSIEALVGDMAFYKRPFARSKLENRTPPCIDLTITHEGGDVGIKCDGRRAAKAKLDGKRRGFTPTGGDPVKVSYAIDNGKLVQKFFSENGVRTNIYRLTDGGKTLKLEVELQSSKLPRPLRFKRTFKKQ
ncbi:MAG: hypothetical protein ACQEVA_09465 [Myxococcota bacterium]